MDIGGDKPVDYLNIPAEANPFLGYRAVRFTKNTPRCSPHNYGDPARLRSWQPKIMIPMISSMEEIYG
ncbi:putative PEP-binding protein [Shigella boydii]